MLMVELLEQALALAEQLGYRVRQDWLGGRSGGCCEIKGQKWIFLDLALSPFEQLEQVAEAVRESPDLLPISIAPDLQKALRVRKAA